MAIRIVADSTSDINIEEAKKLGIDIAPLMVIFGDEEYRDGIDITVDEFYKKIRTSKDFPSTSQVNQLEFEDILNKYIDDEVIVITIATELSGTYGSLQLAIEETGHKNVYSIDSNSVTTPIRYLVHLAVEYKNQGLSAKEIVEKINTLKNKVTLYAAIEDLTYLKKGGRLSSTKAILGQLLNVKPIIRVEDSKVCLAETRRGSKKAYEALVDKFLEERDEKYPYYLSHADAIDKIEILKEKLKEKGVEPEKEISFIGPTVGVHVGPGSIAITYVKK